MAANAAVALEKASTRDSDNTSFFISVLNKLSSYGIFTTTGGANAINPLCQAKTNALQLGFLHYKCVSMHKAIQYSATNAPHWVNRFP
jgi:hypothetical protein